MNRLQTPTTLLPAIGKNPYLRLFPIDSAGQVRDVFVSNTTSETVEIRNINNTNDSAIVPALYSGMLGTFETADMEGRSGTTNIAIVTFFGGPEQNRL